MTDEFLGDRRKSLEETFFAKQNERLRQQLREKQEAVATKEALSAASGINDDAVLATLIELDIRADTLAALVLVPLVEVAWADGRVEDREREAVLSGARDSGLVEGSASDQLLESWLRRRPAPALLESWKEYIGALSGSVSPEAREALKADLLGRARSVAAAAGGLLGFGKKVSREEQAVLDELERAFS